MSHYKEEHHKEVSEKIKSINNIRWIVSYDNVPEIRDLYSECQKKEFSFKHTAYSIREGYEILFFSKSIKQPNIINYDPLRFKLDKENTTAIVYQ
jgi:DNA adenine methylase